MKRAIIVHRWAGGPTSDWYPWLARELENQGFKVLIPEMPDTETPTITNWVHHLDQVVGALDQNTFFIGHSIGCQTILRYLQTVDTKIGGAIFVAPWFFLENLEDQETERIAQPWIDTPIEFPKIKQVCPSVTAFLSTNEPFGCIQKNKEVLEQELSAQVTLLENRGHFTEDDDCRELPEVLDLFKKNQKKDNSKDFDRWNILKKGLDLVSKKFFFKEGEIWWLSIGLNIGRESFGKGAVFRRPVLVLKKLSADLFIGIPMSSQEKTGTWFAEVSISGQKRYALLYQLRTFSVNRFESRLATLDDYDFKKVKEKLEQLLKLSSQIVTS